MDEGIDLDLSNGKARYVRRSTGVSICAEARIDALQAKLRRLERRLIAHDIRSAKRQIGRLAFSR